VDQVRPPFSETLAPPSWTAPQLEVGLIQMWLSPCGVRTDVMLRPPSIDLLTSAFSTQTTSGFFGSAATFM
jgi:hypothetical protein